MSYAIVKGVFWVYVNNKEPEPKANKKKGNDQKSIQLNNTFRQRHQRERRTHLKQQHHNQNTTSRKPKAQFLSQTLAKRLSKMKPLPGKHVKTYNDRYSKPQQKHRFGKPLSKEICCKDDRYGTFQAKETRML